MKIDTEIEMVVGHFLHSQLFSNSVRYGFIKDLVDVLHVIKRNYCISLLPITLEPFSAPINLSSFIKQTINTSLLRTNV